jgi:hypothetical protein
VPGRADWFVGRADELGRLAEACRDVRAGRGRVLVVSGAAGVGKTGLAERGEALAQQTGLRVAWGRCWTGGGAPALWPWRPVLAQLCGAETAALLAEDHPDSAVVDPERFARFVAVGERLTARCAEAPAYLVLDDLHDAEPAAVLLTRFLARLRPRPALLLVVTTRDGTGAAELAAGLEATPVPLREFDLVDTCAFLAACGQAEVEPALARAAHQVTGGNPLLLQRLVALAAADPVDAFADGLRNLVGESVDRIPGPARALVAAAAVLGPAPSVALTAAVAGRPADAVLDAVAAAPGLVAQSGPDELAFAHDLVRDALVGTISAGELLDLHAAAAAALRGWGAVDQHERLARRAYHALRAAARSPADAQRAVDACRAAAASMIARFAYEEAARLLGTAAGLHAAGGVGPSPAALLLEWAGAVLCSGRLTDARELFDHAADAAEAEREPVLAAHAALGLGGVWVDEHRDPGDRERVRARQQAALAALGEDPEHAVLRQRLRTRLAAEAVYIGAPLEPVLAALAETRRLGDRQALAEALSLTHHALLRPDHAADRLPLAEELVAVAAAVGDGVLVLMGLCWRAVDLFGLGDPGAERALADLRARADVLGSRSILYVVSAMDVMLLIRSGRLAEAERAAEASARLGVEVGDADAGAYAAAHLLTIRWLQGRGGELLELADEVAGSPTLVRMEFAFRASVARLAAEAGQPARARRALDRLAAGGLAALPLSSTWLTGMLAVVEAAAALGDARIAAEAYELLLPYADLPVMPSVAVSCFGSTERALGLAALTRGRPDAAVEHLDRAVGANIRLGHRPMTAVCRADLALALRRRGDPGDGERATALLAAAAAEADGMDMPVRARAWRALGVAGDPVRARQEQRHWVLSWGDRRAVVEDLVGMRHLARLLAQPGRPVPALELGGNATALAAEPSRQPVLDPYARRAYLDRARRLVAELADARDRADPRRVATLEREAEALADELHRSTGTLGRTRDFPAPAERARTAVRKAIKRAVEAVSATDPAIGAELRATVTTGYSCCYTPSVRRTVASRT